MDPSIRAGKQVIATFSWKSEKSMRVENKNRIEK